MKDKTSNIKYGGNYKPKKTSGKFSWKIVFTGIDKADLSYEDYGKMGVAVCRGISAGEVNYEHGYEHGRKTNVSQKEM